MTDARTNLPMLPVQCSHCGQPVTLQVAAVDPSYGAAAAPESGPVQPWVCPWCRQRNEGVYPGQLAYVWKGHRQAG